MNVDAAAIACGGTALGPISSFFADLRVITDSRAVRAGDWFLALEGDRFDGHDFVNVALAAGAAGVIVRRDVAPDAPRIVVRNTLRALQDLGRHARSQLAGPVVGLTGSSGKTTTRALCALALAPLGVVQQTAGNLNNHIGVPLTLLGFASDAAASVVEMGTSGPGEIALLADIARPDVRLLVNVGPAHLEDLGGLDGVQREKGCLFLLAGAGDIVCVNLDDPRVVAVKRPAGIRAIGYGRSESAVIRLVHASVDATTLSTLAVYDTPQGRIEARIPIPGELIAHNGAGALAVAHALGVDLRRSAEAFASYEPVGMRMRAETLPNGVIAINDAYNANPASMEASLRVLAGLPGRRIAVLGDMLELGPGEAEWHRQVAALAGELDLDVVYLVGPRMSAERAHCRAREMVADADPMAVVADLERRLHAGDRVLFKGSRGSRIERVLAAIAGTSSPESH
jgi:UDP-N-acetylmuramoyl-tripeptide--D-alanyl-D-alanine ligase